MYWTGANENERTQKKGMHVQDPGDTEMSIGGRIDVVVGRQYPIKMPPLKYLNEYGEPSPFPIFVLFLSFSSSPLFFLCGAFLFCLQYPSLD